MLLYQKRHLINKLYLTRNLDSFVQKEIESREQTIEVILNLTWYVFFWQTINI